MPAKKQAKSPSQCKIVLDTRLVTRDLCIEQRAWVAPAIRHKAGRNLTGDTYYLRHRGINYADYAEGIATKARRNEGIIKNKKKTPCTAKG